MAGTDNKVFVGMEIGTSQVCVAVGVEKNGELEVTGAANEPSRGMRNGVVVSLDKAVECVVEAIDAVRVMSGIDVNKVYLAISGEHIHGENSRGVIGVSSSSNEIEREHVARVISKATPSGLPPEFEIIHVFPQEFRVDRQDGIVDPIGMIGDRLELDAHIVRGSKNTIANVVKCVQKAGLKVEGKVLTQMADAHAVLREDEKKNGVVLLDIGEQMTTMGIFDRGSLWHTKIFSIGGGHFTKDLGYVLNISSDDAEMIKKRHGCVLGNFIDEDEMIEMALKSGGAPHMIPHQLIVETFKPRAEQLFRDVLKEVRQAGYEKNIEAGIVLTGGGSLLSGMVEMAELIFRKPSRIGKPIGIRGLTDMVSSPVYSTAIGVLKYAWMEDAQSADSPQRGLKKWLDSLKKVFFQGYV
ncbi:MAG: cell division protein FtsA [Acidobacteria bacterium]|nr:MAG: cell division protein FtsA [Acidobacteriota bacterium]PIE89665.1 MAG: cell division protein FtsA [Acidobacteriota bacterium]